MIISTEPTLNEDNYAKL